MLTAIETETIDGIEYRDAWLRQDRLVARDAIAFGAAMPGERTSEFWASNLCAMAYAGPGVAGLSQCEFRFSERVRANMAYLQVFASPQYASHRIDRNLILKSHEIARRHALRHPEAKVGGTMLVIEDASFVRPVTDSFMLLAGYTPGSKPVVLRWFDHYKL
jgi:hypothetical protein